MPKPIVLEICPWCRRKPMVLSKYDPDTGTVRWWVECRYGMCPTNPQTYYHADQSAAKRAWNKWRSQWKLN